jgi:hypothetical protein
MTPLPPDASLDTPFRCSHFACLLTVKACIRRQTEQREGRSRSKGKKTVEWSKPLHPHCAEGTCEQGNAIRALFPNHVPEQPADPRAAPRLDLVNQETTMPKTLTSKPGQGAPCRECGSTSRHKKGCSKPPRATTRSTGPRPTSAPRPPAKRLAATDPDGVIQCTTAELLTLRSTIDAELRARLANVEQELLAMRQAVGSSATPPAVRSAG